MGFIIAAAPLTSWSLSLGGVTWASPPRASAPRLAARPTPCAAVLNVRMFLKQTHTRERETERERYASTDTEENCSELTSAANRIRRVDSNVYDSSCRNQKPEEFHNEKTLCLCVYPTIMAAHDMHCTKTKSAKQNNSSPLSFKTAHKSGSASHHHHHHCCCCDATWSPGLPRFADTCRSKPALSRTPSSQLCFTDWRAASVPQLRGSATDTWGATK